jgi:ribosomal protein S27AE
MNILEAMQDLFSKTFRPKLLRDTWGPWRAFLAVLFGLPVDESARAIIAKHTERTDVPNSAGFTEAYAICGRRGGKSIIAALIGAFLACLRDYSSVLAPGETGVVLILASDRKQARVIFSYVKALIEGAAALRKMIVNITKESIELANHIRIEIHTSSFRSVRGYSIVACLCDELAFWQADDGSNPAGEVLKAVRPGMSSIPGAILLGLSSPYAKRGVLFDLFKKYYGSAEAPVLLWRAPTIAMNSTISEQTITTSRELDPAAARSEWDAEFRDDLEAFIPLEVVEARTITGRYELPPSSGLSYSAFVDPSGGSSDSFTLAIAHKESDRAVLDVLREVVAPFSPEDAVKEFVGVLRQYRISTVVGDRYAGEWPREQFRKHSIDYRVSDLNRSELYLALLPLLMSGQCELLDLPRLKNQLIGLERRTGSSGKDSIDHTPSAHDDCSNAAAGALVNVIGSTLVLGLTDYILEEVAKQNGTPALRERRPCPICSSSGPHILFGPRMDNFRCGKCGLTWRP